KHHQPPFVSAEPVRPAEAQRVYRRTGAGPPAAGGYLWIRTRRFVAAENARRGTAAAEPSPGAFGAAVSHHWLHIVCCLPGGPGAVRPALQNAQRGTEGEGTGRGVTAHS